MIQVIVEIINLGDAAHVEKAPVYTTHQVLDIDSPEIESALRTRDTWERRRVIGVQIQGETT